MEFTAITSRQNATLKHLARLAREKKYRLKIGEMVCEGEKMLGEALDSDIRVGAVLVRSGTACDDALLARAAAQGASLLTAEKALFDLATDVETPQGVLFSCERPVRQTVDFSSVHRAVLLDGLQDPGNLGTILRTADAFALDLVILCEGCTDPTAPKVVRATMGAAFRQPVCQMPLAEAIDALQQHGIPVYAAALEPDSVPLPPEGLPERSAVIIGNEGNGVTQAALDLCDYKLIIPMAGRAESLNAGVAAAILIWEMTKKGG